MHPLFSVDDLCAPALPSCLWVLSPHVEDIAPSFPLSFLARSFPLLNQQTVIFHVKKSSLDLTSASFSITPCGGLVHAGCLCPPFSHPAWTPGLVPTTPLKPFSKVPRDVPRAVPADLSPPCTASPGRSHLPLVMDAASPGHVPSSPLFTPVPRATPGGQQAGSILGERWN